MKEQRTAATRPFRLIVHIGPGKTGSTAIQQMLRASGETLRDLGAAYWGMVLENAPARLFPWQALSRVNDLHKIEPKLAEQQIVEVLTTSILQAQENGITQAFWSNERFLRRGGGVRRALLELVGQGIDIQVVAYVRRFDKWSLSQFIQWGVKHKTYEGRQLSFGEFTAAGPGDFLARLKVWRDAFEDKLSLRNYDAVGDVAKDFLEIAGLPTERFNTIRQNESPSPEEIVLRALFNDKIEGKSTVAAFGRTLGQDHLRLDDSLQDILHNLLPGEDDLMQVVETYKMDRETLDAWLTASGQPPVDTTPLNYRPPQIDTGRMLTALADILIGQAMRIRALEEKLDRQQGPDTNSNRKQS